MSLPERIPSPLDSQDDVCRFVYRWGISHELAYRLIMLQNRLEFDLTILSGFRTRDEQQALIDDETALAAPIDVSTHTSCPATGADVWPTVEPVTAVKARLGAEAHLVGLRVGGGGPVDPETGLSVDWNHLDMGRRKR